MQIQLLILQMERQLVIITAMIDRLRRRFGLQRGQRRPRRYWVRPWLSQAECAAGPASGCVTLGTGLRPGCMWRYSCPFHGGTFAACHPILVSSTS